MRTILPLTVIIGLAVLTSGCCNCGSRSGSAVVRAQRFELVNDQGQVVATLANEADGPGLRLYSTDGKARLAAVIAENGPAVMLLGAEDQLPKARLNLANDGHPGLTLLDSNGKVRYDLHLREDERPCMLFWDVPHAKPRLGLGVNPDGNPNLNFFDGQFNKRIWMMLHAEQGPIFGVSNSAEPATPAWRSPEAK